MPPFKSLSDTHSNRSAEGGCVQRNCKFPKPLKPFMGFPDPDSSCHDGFSILIIDRATIILGYPI